MDDGVAEGTQDQGIVRQYDGWADLLVSEPLTRHIVAGAAIQLKLDGLAGEYPAMLDTGAHWSILPYEIAQELHISVEGKRRISLTTFRGEVEGVLEKHSVFLGAREGSSISFDATWFVSEEWPQPMLVGWHGFLEVLAFGCDPGTQPGREKFFFAQL